MLHIQKLFPRSPSCFHAVILPHRLFHSLLSLSHSLTVSLSLSHSLLSHSPISSRCSPLMIPALLPGLPSVLIRFGGSCDHRPNENALPHPTMFVRKEHFPVTFILFYFILFGFAVHSFAVRRTKPLPKHLTFKL